MDSRNGSAEFSMLTEGDCVQDLLELTPKKDVLFIIGDWNAKLRSQETLGVTGKFGLGILNEAGQRLIAFFLGNTLVIANTLFQQHKRRLYTWTSPDGQHQNQIDYSLHRPAISPMRQTGSWLIPLLPTHPPPRNLHGPGSPLAFNQEIGRAHV